MAKRKINLRTVGDLKSFLEDVSDDTPLLFDDQGDFDGACHPWVFEARKRKNGVIIHASF